MSRLYPIASGSSGNCTYIANGNDGILIDAGISAKAITDGLALAGVDPFTLRGIFITHEHTDHISGLRVFSKKYGLPIFARQARLILRGLLPVTTAPDRADTE